MNVHAHHCRAGIHSRAGRGALLISGVLLSALLLSAPDAHGQADGRQPPAEAVKQLRLSRIEVSGLKRATEDEVVAASGLQIGQPVDTGALDAAAERIMNTGLFRNLKYTFRTKADQVVVTFEVEESEAASIPVVFDNFVWFRDEEVVRAVRRELPSFDGTAPESQGVVRTIIRALEQLLRERNIAGRVEYTASADTSGRNAEHIFSVKGAKQPVCALRFPRAAAVSEGELLTIAQPLLGSDYSRKFISEFAGANLIPVYRQRGLLRASFLDPTAKVEAAEGGG
ncbi:MAG: POTRA domain-containing protein, partial [Pyrinomonadaceae bacterium]